MKKIILTSLSAVVLATGAANASNPYAAIRIGYNWAESDTDPDNGPKNTNNGISGFAGGIAGGASWDVSDAMAIRAELEYGYARAKGKLNSGESKSTISDHKALVNGYLDFAKGELAGLTPYVGLSLGYSIGTLDNGDDVNVNGLGLGASVGASYAISDSFAIDLGLRWLWTSREYDEKSAGKGDFDTDEASVLLGARYAF